jgi:GT2 family glycosyltransferase
MPHSVCASVVVYRSDPSLLRATLQALDAAVAHASAAGVVDRCEATLVDNDAPRTTVSIDAYDPGFTASPATAWHRLAGQGNVGYGSGHNLVLHEHDFDLYLVLNPDAVLAPDALTRAIEYLRATPECGLVAPYAAAPSGEPLFLCKRYPDVLTLLSRATAPISVKRASSARIAHYEMRDVVGADAQTPATGVTLASGCCMLIRTDVVRCTNGFDPRFFVYFEDYDLSLRVVSEARSRIDYVPAMRIVHHGGNAAQKDFAHIRMFAVSAIRFFNKHGWKFS